MKKGGISMNNQNDETWLEPLKNRPNLEPNQSFAKELKQTIKERHSVQRRNYLWLKLWIPLTVAVMLFTVTTVSYLTDNQEQGQKQVEIVETTHVVNPDIDALLAENPAYQQLFTSVVKATGIEDVGELVIQFFEALHVKDKEFLKNNVFFVANPEKEVDVLLNFYEGIDVRSLEVNTFKESRAEPSVEIVFSYKQNNEEMLHHIHVNYWEEGQVEIYAPLDDYVPEIQDDLELNEQERAAYDAFIVDHNPQSLLEMGPISIAKMYYQANVDGDQDTSYALYTTREDRIMWSKEEDKEYFGSGTPEGLEEAYRGLGAGTFHQFSEIEGYISFRNHNGDYGFQMIKDENGVWKVAFTPFQ